MILLATTQLEAAGEVHEKESAVWRLKSLQI